jgi:hypothetical protein
VFTAEMAGRQNPDQQRDTADADQRDGVGQVHRGSTTFQKATGT